MRPNDDREYQKAMSKYSASFMSDAKWLKLFRAIIQAEIQINRAEWRFIDSTHSIWESFPSSDDLMPTRFADGRFQPFEYRWLESVFIPCSYKPIPGVGYERQQNTAAVLAALAAVGQFPIEESTIGITINAYRRQTDA